MLGGGAVLLLLVVVGGGVLSLAAWRVFRSQAPEADSVPTKRQVDILLILLVMGAFALGAFLTYALLHAF